MQTITKTIVVAICSLIILTGCEKTIEIIKEVPVNHIGATQKATYMQIIASPFPNTSDSLMARYAIKISSVKKIDSVDFEYRCISTNRAFGDIIIPRSEFILASATEYISDSSTVLIYLSKKKFGRYIPILLGPAVVQNTLTSNIWVRLRSSYTIEGTTYKREAEDFNPLGYSASKNSW